MIRSYAPAVSLVFVAGLLLTGIACSPDPADGTLEQNVAASFAPCSANEIKFMTSKHNFQTVFRECGGNDFSAYGWNPAGTHMYFQLVMTPYVMDADAATKPTVAIPTTTPIGPATWISTYRLLIPVGPDETGTKNRLALYDLEQQSIFHVDTDLTKVAEVHSSGDPNSVFILGEVGSNRGIFRVDTTTGKTTTAFDWLSHVPTSFTYQPNLDVVVLGKADNTVSLLQGGDGKAIGTWPNAKRGSLHSGGRYLMLEHMGEPVSIFYQRTWDEMSQQARERELRRAKRFEDSLAASTPKTVQPPTLSWVDLFTGERWMLTSAYGNWFSWYEPSDHYGSFFLWGFEGKQFKRNVVLGQFGGRFISMQKGRKMMGVERFEAGDDPNYKPPTGAVPAPEPAGEAPAPE